MKDFKSNSLEETANFAKEWLESLTSQNKATVVGLSGHLGAGKTAFVKSVAKIIGITETVTSPTFVIMKRYEIKNAEWSKKWVNIIHIDAYRLERFEALEAIQWKSLVSDPRNLILVEWPENVGLSDLDAHLDFEIKDGAYTIM